MNDGTDGLATSKERSATAGTLLLTLGLILAVGRGMETAFGIPGMPRTWYQNDWLWWLTGLASIIQGGRLLARSESPDAGLTWRPSQPGRRFNDSTLYTREGCHLCEEAAELIEKYKRWLPSPTLIDIDSDPKLIEKFGTCVPVFALDGKVRFRGKVDETLLRRLIEGTPPNENWRLAATSAE